MRGQEQAAGTGLSGLALMALRAEMEALALLMPGVFAPVPATGARSAAEEEAEAEALFENMPL
jgi:hypothetical protein